MADILNPDTFPYNCTPPGRPLATAVSLLRLKVVPNGVFPTYLPSDVQHTQDNVFPIPPGLRVFHICPWFHTTQIMENVE